MNDEQMVWVPSNGNGGSHPNWVALVKVSDLRKALADIDQRHAPLMKFYSVETVDDLIAAMEQHIARLQSRVPPSRAERLWWWEPRKRFTVPTAE